MKTEVMNWRKARLQAAADKAGGDAELGRLLGFKSGTQVGHMRSGRRPITEKTISKIEALRGYRGWFSQQGDEGGNTNAVIDKQEILEALVATIVGLPQPVRNLLADDMALLARAPGDADTQSRVLALLMQSPCAAGIRTQDFAGRPPCTASKAQGS